MQGLRVLRAGAGFVPFPTVRTEAPTLRSAPASQQGAQGLVAPTNPRTPRLARAPWHDPVFLPMPLLPGQASCRCLHPHPCHGALRTVGPWATCWTPGAETMGQTDLTLPNHRRLPALQDREASDKEGSADAIAVSALMTNSRTEDRAWQGAGKAQAGGLARARRAPGYMAEAPEQTGHLSPSLRTKPSIRGPVSHVAGIGEPLASPADWVAGRAP